MKGTIREIENNDDSNKPKQHINGRGIPNWKKDGIVKNLCKLMPVQKQLFWQNIASKDNSVDLTKGDDQQ